MNKEYKREYLCPGCGLIKFYDYEVLNPFLECTSCGGHNMVACDTFAYHYKKQIIADQLKASGLKITYDKSHPLYKKEK